MRSETKYWYADRVKLLDKFAAQVADGLWHKMPYKTWRTLAHTSVPKLIIERSVGEDDNYEYRVYENTCITFTIYEDFGAFLDNVFGSPTLTYEAEAKQNMYSNITADTCSSLNYDYNKYATGGYVSGNSITINSEDYPNWTSSTIVMKTPCDEDDVRRICKDIINNKDKENKKMDTSNLFNFDFGPVSGSQFRMSPYGLAVRTQANGWVAFNAANGELMDVDVINFDLSKMIYKMPVAQSAIAAGDILIHGGKPVFVRNANTNDGTVNVIDYSTASVMDILPVKSPFGFNFFTKVVCFVDMNGASAASPDNPFGGLLPFLMMGEGKDFDPMMLMFMGGNMNFTNNPMMMYFMLNSDGKDNSNLLPLFLMMNSGNMPSGNAGPATI